MISPFIHFLTKSFYVKMIAIMVVLSIIPLVALSYVSISISGTTVKEQVNQLNSQLVKQAIDRIELSMERLQEIIGQYSRMPGIPNALIPPSELYSKDVVRKRELISLLSTTSAVIGNLKGMMVYSAASGEVLSSSDIPATLEASPYKPLIEALLSSGKAGLFLDKDTLPLHTALEETTYYVGRIPLNPYEEVKGALVIAINNTEYGRQIQNVELGSGSISLLTPGGATIATTSKLEKSEDELRIERLLDRWHTLGKPDQFSIGTSIISVEQTSTYDRWIVVSEIPSAELAKNADMIRQTVTYVLILLILFGSLTIAGFGYRLYRPLRAMKRQVAAFKSGRFEASSEVYANNEIGELGRMLNTMAIRIQELLAEQQHSENLKRRLEIRALQSQINPHFMYNTLNTIRMFAILKDYDRINALMGRLVSMLRYSMENENQYVPLQEELSYLSDYIELINMRYKDQVVLLTEVEVNLAKLPIPRLSLQPLIENAVFHGILPKKIEEGRIIVRVAFHPDLGCPLIEVEDDGQGMSEKEVEKLRARLQRDERVEGIGLQNVWLRFRFMFGRAARVELHSKLGAGTTIRFTLASEQAVPIYPNHEKGDCP
ncbi:cache domain-containing sensor histidine kinase [Paenibacillus luteus]|uniref:cache domain-containing sensor histidine kinase n=1 Tax=Paenibacillus luteus TaxID=2545753 RepID=UPI001142F117|nr:sensor histidine kinase [Paenibacillus luteus]